MTTDVVAEQISWMDGIFTHAENRNLFDEQDQLAIQSELLPCICANRQHFYSGPEN